MKLNLRTIATLLGLLVIPMACNLPADNTPAPSNEDMMSTVVAAGEETFVPQTQTAMASTMTTATTTPTPFQPSYAIETIAPATATPDSRWTDSISRIGKVYSYKSDFIEFIWGTPNECEGAISVGEGYIFDNVTAVRSTDGTGIQFTSLEGPIGGIDVTDEFPCLLVTVNYGTGQRAVMP